MYIKSKETAEYGEYLYDYNVTKADDNKSLLINSRDPHKKPIIINISDVPELLSIKPNDVLIFYANDEKTGNIKFLFGQSETAPIESAIKSAPISFGFCIFSFKPFLIPA